MLSGELLIGGQATAGVGAAFRGIDASTGDEIAEPMFRSASGADVERACALAEAAFEPFSALPLTPRAELLERIAQRVLDIGKPLVERAMRETGLPRPRLEGELARTVGQLRTFATLVRSGIALDARIEPALPERQPPRTDVRFMRVAVGPVAVFGASNFPLAFSVAGGDTAAALAAGCPVVVKAHPAHPGTSELVGRALQAAVRDTGLHEGVFSLLFDAGHDVGAALVAHPAIQAVGFTGSRAGGLALMRIAAARPVPIPVLAEMSSVNPLVLLPGALAARAASIAQEFTASMTLGCGQLCTQPGLVLAIGGDGLDAFIAAAAQAVRDMPAGVMLTPGIAQAYERGTTQLAAQAAVTTLARGPAAPGRAQAALFNVDAHALLADAALAGEVFGPCSLLVRCDDEAQLRRVLSALEGQLTATLHIEPADHAIAQRLLPLLQRKAGRVLVNAFPTGVEVCDAMVHGGPFPATSDGRSTSVGTAAIERFLRPVCFQNLPDALLPAALQAANPWAIPRRSGGIPQDLQEAAHGR